MMMIASALYDFPYVLFDLKPRPIKHFPEGDGAGEERGKTPLLYCSEEKMKMKPHFYWL